MGGNRHEAEDACSLVMLKAREKFFRYSRKLERPKAWLTRLARNLCIDIARRKNRETRKIESIDRIDPETSPKLISPIDPPEKLLLETEMTRVIYRKISALPPLLKTPFALFFYRSMSPLAIARHLGISVEAIYKRLRKARSLLRESLEGYRFSSPIEA
jgi:RNA polymerase sigma-70 factor (ECF subfamily)